MKSIDAWLTREPSISEAEWFSALAERDDFEVVEQSLGRAPNGQVIELLRLYIWRGCSSGEVAFAYSPTGIHASPLDAESWAFVQALAQHFGASAIEG